MSLKISMRTIGSKIALGVGGVVGILLVLVLALALLAPKLMNAEALKGQLQAALLEKTGGHIDYQRTELSYFPLPKLEIHQVSLSIPDTVAGSIKSLEIYPDLFALFRGELRLTELEIEGPDLSLTLPEKAEKEEEKPDRFSGADLHRVVATILAPLSLHSPEMSLEIRDGTLVLSEKGKPVISARNLNLDVDFSADSSTLLRADVQGAVPELTLFRGEEKVVIAGDKLKGTIRGDQEKITASIAELTLTQPELDVTGTFSADRTGPDFFLEIQGRNVNVESTREAALALFGHMRTTQAIFDIVRGGTVPQISFQTQGHTPSELGDLDNIRISGRMQNGKIFVPAVDLHLEETNGEVVIAGGILEGKDLSARLEKSRGEMGELKIGLQGGDAPFHLDLMIDADLAQLLPILERVVNNRAFVGELKRISKLRGRGRGTLVLGERLKFVEAKVDVEELQLSADYQRIPFPVDIQQGIFSFSETRVGIKNLAGKVGRSTFTDLSYNLHWRNELSLAITSGRFDLVLDELYPWISSFTALRKSLKEVKEAKGRLELSSLSLKGLVGKPEQWQFEAAGRVKEVDLNTSLVPEALHLAGGSFQVKPKNLSFRNVQGKALDSALDLSGILRGVDSGVVSLSGNIGPKATEWLRNYLELAPIWAVQAPLALSRSELKWKPGSALSVKGDIAFPKGPRVSADLSYRPEVLSINRLSVQDGESDATLSLRSRNNGLDLQFSGSLHHQTVNDMFVSQKLSSGWLSGDIQASILPDLPEQSTAQGALQGGNILIPLKTEEPVHIESIAVAARGHRIDISNSALSWGKQRAAIKGGVDIAAKGYVLDLNVSAGDIPWNDIDQFVVAEKDVKGTEPDKPPWDLPVSGKIRLSAKSFTWQRFTWQPVRAEISIGPGTVAVKVDQAQLCGISTPGTLTATGEGLALDFQPSAVNQQLTASYACLTDNRIKMTGAFDLTGRIFARGQVDTLMNALRGSLSITARKGQITRHKLFSRILEIVNVTEIYKGKYPDLKRKGFPYDAITAKGHLKDGRFFLNEFFLDGETMEVVGSGEFDLGRKTMDVKLLVEPMKTFNTVIKKIPGINYLLGGSLVSIPVSAQGDITDPRVTILSPSEVGSGLLRFAERVLNAPLKIIEPIIPATGTK